MQGNRSCHIATIENKGRVQTRLLLVPFVTGKARRATNQSCGSIPNSGSGNLQGLTAMNAGLTFNQNFLCDHLNRLTTATDSGGWSRTFGYDEWGNMWLTGSSGVPLAGNTPTSNVYNPANNQISGQAYDAAGNQLSANGNTASYDAENRIVSITEAPAYGGGSETLAYDGNGQRVEKTFSSGGATVYVYDAFGQLVAEYETQSATPPCTTCYLSYDHLGSVRMVTDQNANVIARHDYLPFGEEIPAGWAGRNSQFGVTDYVDPRFTGQIRDQEAGLDYFGGTRMSGTILQSTRTRPEPIPTPTEATPTRA
jgi:YD repeat-containing protein